MKKMLYTIMVVFAVATMLQGCGSRNESIDISQPSTPLENNISENNTSENITSENNTSEDIASENNISGNSIQENVVTKEMAYEGVNNYSHSEYDWSPAEENPSIMYIEMGEETESEYQVVFHSYTGAVVNFYVDKLTGNTRMVEYVPTLNTENEAGTFNLHDYLNKD